MNHEKSSAAARYHPQPAQAAASLPRRLINISNISVCDGGTDGLIVRRDSRRSPVNDFLHRASTYMHTKHRTDEFLHSSPAVAVHAAQFGNQRGESRPETGFTLIGNMSSDRLATGGTFSCK